MSSQPKSPKSTKWFGIGWKFTGTKLMMFVDEMERSLDLRMNSLKEKHKEKLEKIKLGMRGVSLSGSELDEMLKIDGIPLLMRRAVFLVVFGVFEDHVSGLCHLLIESGAVSGLPPKNSHLNGSREFLLKTARIDPSAFGPDWTYVDGARCVRNFVAHDCATILHSDLSSQAKVARDFIKQEQNTLMDDELIVIRKGFLETLLDRMDGAMEKLIDNLK